MSIDILRLGYNDLVRVLPTLTEDELYSAINYEVSTYQRTLVITRLHQRYSKLRTMRERELLLAGKFLL